MERQQIGVSRFVCCLCRIECPEGGEALKEHISVDHLGWIPYQCNYCRSVYLPSENAVDKHFQDTHPNAPSKVTYNFDMVKTAELTRLFEQSVSAVVGAAGSNVGGFVQPALLDRVGLKCEDGVPLYNASMCSSTVRTPATSVVQPTAVEPARRSLPVAPTNSSRLSIGDVTITPPSLQVLRSPSPITPPVVVTRNTVRKSAPAGPLNDIEIIEASAEAKRKQSPVVTRSVKLPAQQKPSSVKVTPRADETICNLCNTAISSVHHKMRYHVYRHHLAKPMAECRRCDYKIMHEDRSGIRKRHNDAHHPDQQVQFSEWDKAEVEADVKKKLLLCFGAVGSPRKRSAASKVTSSKSASLTKTPTLPSKNPPPPATDASRKASVKKKSHRKSPTERPAAVAATMETKPILMAGKIVTGEDRKRPATAMGMMQWGKQEKRLCQLCNQSVHSGLDEHVWMQHMDGKAPFECRLCEWRCFHQDLARARRHVHKRHPRTSGTLRDLRNKPGYGDTFVERYTTAFPGVKGQSASESMTAPAAKNPKITTSTEKGAAASSSVVQASAPSLLGPLLCAICNKLIGGNRSNKKKHIWRTHMGSHFMHECGHCTFKSNEAGYEHLKKHHNTAHADKVQQFKDNREAYDPIMQKKLAEAFGVEQGAVTKKDDTTKNDELLGLVESSLPSANIEDSDDQAEISVNY